MVEHSPCKRKVIGSNPIAGSTFMEEEYEQIDKIISRALADDRNAAVASGFRHSFRKVVKEALEEGHAIGYDSGYDEGYDIGYCEGAGVTDLKAKYGRE